MPPVCPERCLTARADPLRGSGFPPEPLAARKRGRTTSVRQPNRRRGRPRGTGNTLEDFRKSGTDPVYRHIRTFSGTRPLFRQQGLSFRAVQTLFSGKRHAEYRHAFLSINLRPHILIRMGSASNISHPYRAIMRLTDTPKTDSVWTSTARPEWSCPVKEGVPHTPEPS